MTYAPFPLSRPRRMRAKPWIRDLIEETALSPKDLIWPIFIREGENIEEPIETMPHVARLSVDRAVEAAKQARDAGIGVVALFPYTEPSLKTETCDEAWNENNLVNQATRAIKANVDDLGVLLDVALDPYNALGHDGIVRDGKILNDETLVALEKQALIQAESGADILGPSDMMDGRIGVIRSALEANEHHDVMIMSYAAKFASSFYGPFRDAVGADTLLKGDKKTYQINPANRNEALLMVERDLKEGADMVMVKPGMPYLDICRDVKERINAPVFAYQVSGEYAMLEAAINANMLERQQVITESLLSFKRAGCSGILSYHALSWAQAYQKA